VNTRAIKQDVRYGNHLVSIETANQLFVLRFGFGEHIRSLATAHPLRPSPDYRSVLLDWQEPRL
jgi:hypothetical protein